MKQTTRTAARRAIIACAALSIACADAAQAQRGSAPAPGSSSTQTAEAREAADAAEYRAYRLSTAVLTRIDAATRSFMQEIKSDPTYQAFLAAQREHDALEDKDFTDAGRTEAEEARMEQLRKTLDASPFGGGSDGESSLDEAEAEIAKMPAMANALRANGVAPREYVKFIGVLIQAYAVVGTQAAAGQASLSGSADAQLGAAVAGGLAGLFGTNLAPENVAFVTANHAAIDQFMQTMQELSEP